MGSQDENKWNEVWSRQNLLSRFVDFGRKIYNGFFLRIISAYLKTDSVMLELGCGTSTLLLLAAPKIKQAVGLDISAEALKISEANACLQNIANAAFVKGDCVNVPYKDEFDFVWSQGLIEHFADPERIAREHFKAVKPGGTVLIAVPYLYSYMYIWWIITRPKIFRSFWPWTEQVFFTQKTLAGI